MTYERPGEVAMMIETYNTSVKPFIDGRDYGLASMMMANVTSLGHSNREKNIKLDAWRGTFSCCRQISGRRTKNGRLRENKFCTKKL